MQGDLSRPPIIIRKSRAKSLLMSVVRLGGEGSTAPNASECRLLFAARSPSRDRRRRKS